jgi:hypothetical protein
LRFACDDGCHGSAATSNSPSSEEVAIEVDRRVLRHGLGRLARAGVAPQASRAEASSVAGIRGLRLGSDGKDIAQSGYVKPLGQVLFELRVDHDAVELGQMFGADLSTHPKLAELAADAILLRVFCTFYGDKIVLLLSGLDKGADPKAQPRAIRAARKLLGDWQVEQAATKRKSGKR